MSEATDLNPAARRPAVGARRPFFRRKKSCPFSGPLSLRTGQNRAVSDYRGLWQEAA
jgi:hypothetical protein